MDEGGSNGPDHCDRECLVGSKERSSATSCGALDSTLKSHHILAAPSYLKIIFSTRCWNAVHFATLSLITSEQCTKEEAKGDHSECRQCKREEAPTLPQLALKSHHDLGAPRSLKIIFSTQSSSVLEDAAKWATSQP